MGRFHFTVIGITWQLLYNGCDQMDFNLEVTFKENNLSVDVEFVRYWDASLGLF